MKIKDITTDVFNNDNVTYVLDGVSKLDVVAAGEHVTFSVTFKYKSTVTTLPSKYRHILILNIENYRRRQHL